MKKRPSKKSEINLNKKKKSPSISRSITESMVTFIRAEKYVLLASLSGVFFFCLMLYMVVQLSVSLQVQKRVEVQREKVFKDIIFWQDVVVDRPDYRDGYFMLALLQYRIGKATDAGKNVEKALEIDPNFEEGRQFKQLLRDGEGN